MADKFHFAIDRGGTFTDIYATIPPLPTVSNDADRPAYTVIKLLSVDPTYSDAPREGIRRILDQYSGTSHPADQPVSSAYIGSIRMGTTVATNALLERKGARTCFVVTHGFGDLLHIGNQSRPRIFDLEIAKPELLYETVVEIDERVRVLPASTNGNTQANTGEYELDSSDEEVTGLTGERVIVMKKPHLDTVRQQLQTVYDTGIRSLSITLAHSYTFAQHEEQVAAVATSVGFTHVTLSSHIMPMVKLVSRGFTACADSYLTPCIQEYLTQFLAGFDSQINENARVLFMQSDGGLAEMKHFNGFRAVLSGPAGGVVGFAVTTPMKRKGQQSSDSEESWLNDAVIGFDMGGTSTDVSRYAGQFEHVFENTTAGVTIQAPQLDINTVAAGGGSILFFRSGMFVVGPDSAGADPGPACYRRGGPLTITDANLFLGRLMPQHFPKIFGPQRNEPLDTAATDALFRTMTQEINDYWSMQPNPRTMSEQEVALGFISVANETMCRPIRALTQAKGYDIAHHTLCCFGGAGGQHASAIARNLGMRSIYIHRFSGILSAYGIGLADIVHELQEPAAMKLTAQSLTALEPRIQSLKSQAVTALHKQGFSDSDIDCAVYLNLRYHGTDMAMMTRNDEGLDYRDSFVHRYRQEFGFALDREILIDDIRVRGVGRSLRESLPSTPARNVSLDGALKPQSVTRTYYQQGWLDTAVYQMRDLRHNDSIDGPAIVMDATSTILIEPGCHATLQSTGDLLILVGDTNNHSRVTEELDSIQLSIFSHRFMSIAEQMGRTLQRTSISTNIKERLDFSAAIFGPDGSLVANAPHLPVHLGAMQEAVKYQVRKLGDEWREGDVILSNHPQAGGSHLPDCTVITPVFHNGEKVFFVACRGHHADIGGLTPGSMPPFSKLLREEGAAIESFKIVNNRHFDEAGITMILITPSGPNCVGTRNLGDNLSDMKAQVAANHRGIQLMQELIQQYSLSVVHAYMKHIQSNAELSVREMLQSLSHQLGLSEIGTVTATDYMDDGSVIHLSLTIDRRDGSAIFDFTGTSSEVYGNTNAPPAVTYSAVIYCLRCLVNRDVPLNQGCLNSVKIVIPKGCFLNPSAEAAVVGGNVLTSQRVTDVVLKACEACAASQGCMNNLTFGDEQFGYYETIAGGAGAGRTWHGQSGVHTHMTNTRITDPEILERRYPVILRQFSLRPNSGGRGLFRGGDGIVRELEFLRPLTIGILSERRAFTPYGLHGGEDAKRGVNLIRTKEGRTISLGGKNTYNACRGDRLIIQTPGGGGYGTPQFKSESDDAKESDQVKGVETTTRATKTFVVRGGGSLAEWQAMQEQA